MEQVGSNWTRLRNSRFEFFRASVEKTQITLKSDKITPPLDMTISEHLC